MIINHNLPALSSYNAAAATQFGLTKALQKLSSGLRINSAADDAAGLAISEKMRAQVRGLDQAERNAQDGVSMIQTAEGSLQEVHSIIQRMRELSVQAANDTLTSNDRSYIQLEIDQLKDEIDRISGATQFNKRKLLDGTSAVLWSSDELTTETIINGSLSGVDQFGQKISAEGNYKIEISAMPGEAQVQKSNVMKIADDQPPVKPLEWNTAIPAATVEINIGTVNTGGTGYTFVNNVLTLTDSNQVYKITGTAVDRSVSVDTGISATVILSGVSITGQSGAAPAAAFDTNGASVHLFIEGVNELTGGNYHAGLEVGPTAALVIDSAKDGELTAAGGTSSAGIGGQSSGYSNGEDDGYSGSSGNITINGGNITAQGHWHGAGIGGGWGGNGGTTTINGGVIRAASGITGAAGIGSGNDGLTGGNITINGGEIYAYGGGINSNSGGGAGLGGGDRFAYSTDSTCDGGVITINGGRGIITGGWRSAGIGGGPYSKGAVVTVDGGWDLGDATKDIPATITTKDGEFSVLGWYESGEPDELQAKNIGRGFDGRAGTLTMSGFTPEYARTPKTLRDMPEFYDANGVFSVSSPQVLTVYQGDGKKTNVILYGDDTMYDVSKKINDAIANGLGQGAYVDGTGNFCTLSAGTSGTSESVYSVEALEPYYTQTNEVYDDNGNVVTEAQQILAGYRNAYYSTMLVRSAVPGAAGELTFTGDEELLKKLGLSTIQESRESEFYATVSDAHTGETIGAASRKITGNILYGAVTENIDIKFDPLADIKVNWNEKTKRFDFSPDDNTAYTTYVHLSDNPTVLQIGANDGEDMILHFANCSSSALGLDGLSVVSREAAARAITIIDSASTRILGQMAKFGAYLNRLEHTINNLAAAGENLTASESRIRDADMAKEMMNFTKLNILLQSGNSMMSQANQLPQAVLSLLR